tara:strand:- start:3188 stop:7651 length:4464 start_codon:yes stop_codon:yes gene_type:complete
MTIKFTDLSKRLSEQKSDTVVFAFGRFNPPTIGHEKLFKKVESEGKRAKDHFVYASHSEDNKKNPLNPRLKQRILKKAFPRNNVVISSKQMPTALHIASALYEKGYKNLVMVAGSDRVQEFKKLLDRYNNEKSRHGFYNYETINVVSSGERDADAEDVSGASGTKMRMYAAKGDYESFKKYSPSKLSDREVKQTFDAVRKALPNLQATMNFPVISVREQYLLGEVFNVGDIIVDLNEEQEYEIVEQGPNFVYVKDEEGTVYTKWLTDISEKKKDDKKDRTEIPQDRDIKDKKGTQPAKYYKGMSKSTKDARHAFFKKQDKSPDSDPSTYKPAPGDATGKTKPSKHTKKFKQMFGDESIPEKSNPRIPRKPGQPANSKKHSDLYTDENPKGTIQGLGFKDVETAKASVNKIEKSGKTHAHKIQAAIAMEQRAKVMGKKAEAAVYREYIEKMKKKTKEMQKESLWDNIRKKRERIKRGSGEKMRKVGDKGAPTPAQMQRAKAASEDTDEDLDKFIKDLEDNTPNEKQFDEKAPNTADAMKRYKSGKAGFTDIAHLKAKGLIKRADGTKKKSPKYEEVELDERSLTPDEKKKLRKYEKDVPMKDFIDRYGKDEGPSIYYATITKMAKGEEVDLEELPKGTYLRKDPKLPNLKIQVKRRRGKIIKSNFAEFVESYEIGKDYAKHTADMTPGQNYKEIMGEKKSKVKLKVANIDDLYEDEYDDNPADDPPSIDSYDEPIPYGEPIEVPDTKDLEKELFKQVDKIDDLEDIAYLYQEDDDAEFVDEKDFLAAALTPSQRFKRAAIMKRLAKKIARRRALALKRPSSNEKLKQKSRKHAINLLRKKFARGKPYNELGFAQRARIDDIIRKKSAVVGKIAVRLLPKIKKMEMERIASNRKSQAKNEEVQFEQINLKSFLGEAFDQGINAPDQDSEDLNKLVTFLQSIRGDELVMVANEKGKVKIRRSFEGDKEKIDDFIEKEGLKINFDTKKFGDGSVGTGGVKINESTQELMVASLVLLKYKGGNLDSEEALKLIDDAKTKFNDVEGASARPELLAQYDRNFNDLATAISSSNAILKVAPNPSKVYWTGKGWHKDIAKFNPKIGNIKDYNSSDIVVKSGNKFYGFSLKKKKQTKDIDPTLINKPITGEKSMLKDIVGDADMTKIERAKDMFFNFGIETYFKRKKNLKRGDISKMSSKERDALIREIPTRVWGTMLKNPRNIFYRRVEQVIKSHDKDFVEKFLNLVFRTDLGPTLEGGEFDFYLLTGIGQMKGDTVQVENAETKDLKGIVEGLQQLYKTNLSIDKTKGKIQAYEQKASAAKLFLTISSEGTPILDIEIRYKGSYTANPQFQATATADLKKIFKSMNKESVELDEDGCPIDLFDHVITEAEYQGKKVKLNDPIRTSENPNKKFKVYVKDGDKIKVVRFGDPNMSIKRDDPERRKNFRARHNCDNPGPKTKARYWSCFQWRAKSPVNNENEPEIGRRLTFKESLKDK